MMKHHGFTLLFTGEAMGWLRTVRPGSVIGPGPQQQFLCDKEPLMLRAADNSAGGGRRRRVQSVGWCRCSGW